MAETKSTAKALQKGIKLRIGSPHVVKVLPPAVPRVRLVGMHFELNKAFLLPTAMPGIKEVRAKYAGFPEANLLVVGHTDTSGKDDYNLELSLERAEAVAAYLKDDTAAWDAFYSHKNDGKRWGTRETQWMMSALPESGEKFYPGAPSGFVDGKMASGLKKFQAAKGLPQTGAINPETRKALIKDYMGIDATTLPAGIKLTAHGCGENFPAKATADGVQSADDRRVEMLFFDGPIQPPPPGKTSKKGSAEYPAWIALVTETTDVATGLVTADTFRIRIHGDAEAILERKDKFRLFNGEGFAQTLSLTEDAVQDSDTVELLYRNVPVKAAYSLEVLREDGDPYFLFENVPFAEIDALGETPAGPEKDPLEPEPGTGE